MADEATRPANTAEGTSVQGYLLRTETGDLYAIPLAELEHFRLSAEQRTALQAASGEDGEVSGYCLGGQPGSVGPGFFTGGYYCLVPSPQTSPGTPTVVPVYSTAYGNPLSGKAHPYSSGATG